MRSVSVCLVSYNTRDLLRACLRSVESSEPAAEIVVVDNASADGSADLVRREFPDARLIVNRENRGFAAAMNQALRAATGDYLLLLNPDAELVGDALPRLVAFLESRPSVAAVGPRLVYGDGRPQHAAFAFPTLWQVLLDFFPLHGRLLDSPLNGRYPPAEAPHPIDHPLGACMLLRRAALEDVGLLDEGFFIYAEEVDWCLRAKRRGWEIYHLPEALAVHHAGQATRQARGRMFVELHRSRFRLYRKHYSPAFRRAASALTRVGVWSEARRARRLAARGGLDPGRLDEWLEACRQVAELAKRGGEG